MLVSEHLEKLARLEEMRARLDPADDYELWYFSGLTLCVNAMNAALHTLGATTAERCFAHNVPVYIRETETPGVFEPVIRPFGDIEHIEGPETEALVPAELDEAKRALIWMEDIRDPSVRGELEITDAVIEGVRSACDTCVRVASACVERTDGGGADGGAG
ncbi:MAG: hypothetical protein OXJ56_00345 [Rhodospirillaceae bacterium]|nr:hypothetical protein [Rhodospirillaceae bacterium]